MHVPDVQHLARLLSGPLVMTVARFVGAGAGFLAQVVLARLLPEALGIFFVATSLAALLGLLATQGYPLIVQRFITRYRQKASAGPPGRIRIASGARCGRRGGYNCRASCRHRIVFTYT